MASVLRGAGPLRLFLAIGFPAREPASGFVGAAAGPAPSGSRSRGNRRLTPVRSTSDIAGPFAETVPAYVKRLIAET